MPSERINPRPWALRSGLEHLREDVAWLKQGILDRHSFLAGRKKVLNPVLVEVRGADGKLKARRYTSNLRTNDGVDWQSRIMGGGQLTANFSPAFTQNAATAVAVTAPTSTTVGKLVDTSANINDATHTVVLNQFIGCTLIYFDTTVKAVHIVGHKASAAGPTVTWYFDQWFDPIAPQTTVAAGAANKGYMIIPGGPAFYVGLSVNSGAQAATDHTLGNVTSGASSEIGSGFTSAPAAAGLGRVWAGGGTAGVWTHVAGSAGVGSYTLKNTFTSTGTFTAVQQCGMFTANYCPGDTEGGDLTNVGQGGGVMAFENSFSSVNLISGDTLAVTWQVSI